MAMTLACGLAGCAKAVDGMLKDEAELQQDIPNETGFYDYHDGTVVHNAILHNLIFHRRIDMTPSLPVQNGRDVCRNDCR